MVSSSALPQVHGPDAKLVSGAELLTGSAFHSLHAADIELPWLSHAA